MSNTDDFADELRRQQIEHLTTDCTDKPWHYNRGIQTTDYICSWGMDFCEGNIVKYITRWKYKDGLEDLKKARWYIDKLIADIEKSQSKAFEKSQSKASEKSQSKAFDQSTYISQNDYIL
tara:strand:- start:542 stop:901 length:360 start_codon:yes stop_codon:yes gene_type:complete